MLPANIEIPKEECGVFGIFFPHEKYTEQIGLQTLVGLFPNQHRGEESAGIAVADGKRILPPYKRMGLIRSLYKEYKETNPLLGYIGIGQNRYSTTGTSNLENAGPFRFESDELGPLALAHNGNIVNAALLRNELESQGIKFASTTDSEVIGALIVTSSGDSWSAKISTALSRLKGSFSLVMCTKDLLYGARDPHGIRPLSLAQFEKDEITGFALSSETSAFYTLGINNQAEVARGTLIEISKNGIEKTLFARPEEEAFCGLEIAYLMRPDSYLGNVQLDRVRRHLGAVMAEKYPPENEVDCVTFIPESAKQGAEGFAQRLTEVTGHFFPVKTSLLKGRYGTIDGVVRGFINPNAGNRKNVADSYFPLDWLKDKSIVMVDDSIVRGNTTRGVVDALRHIGVRQIHLRIIFPPVKGFCPLGTDINSKDWLIADHYNNTAEIANYLGVNSLAYLTPNEFRSEVNGILGVRRGLCLGCCDGNYPVNEFTADKMIFEK